MTSIPKLPPEIKDGLHDGCVLGIGIDVLHERSVDLQSGYGIALQKAERSKACPIIIERDTPAERSQAIKKLQSSGIVS